jgi:hypothetical protein
VKVAYIRMSKKNQNPEIQRRDLLAFGCERVFEEQISSRKEDRPELRAAMDYCREGVELVVWKLHRFGRSLRERGVDFVFLRESIDTAYAGREARLPRLRGGGRVRVGPDPGENHGVPGGGEGPWQKGRQEAYDEREENRARLQAHARPRDAHLGVVRGGRDLAGDTLPVPVAGWQAAGSQEGRRGAVMGPVTTAERMTVRRRDYPA